MSNEEFQKLLLEELRSLKEGQRKFEARLDKFEENLIKFDERQERFDERQERFDERQERFDERQERFEKKLDAVIEQTAQLVEFRTEVNIKLDNIIEDNKSIHEMLGEHEVSIRTLKRKVV